MNSVKLEGRNVSPSKIICIGRNYVGHIEELNNEIPTEAVIFLKPNSSIAIDVRTSKIDAIHFEGEICFLIRAGGLYGVGFGLDLTKRDVQNRLKSKGLPWERAKAFDGSAVFSEFVRFDGDTAGLRMELYINDELAQEGGCSLMLNKPETLLQEVGNFLSAEDDDLLMTGTPKGVGAVKLDDKFRGRIFDKEKLIVEGSWVVK